MEITIVYKWMRILGLTFFTISLVELILIILFNSIIGMDLNGDLYSIGVILFISGFMPFHTILIDIIIIGGILIFLILGFTLFLVSKKQVLKDFVLAKFLLLIGLFLIIGSLFKMTFLVFLGKTEINTGTISIAFQNAVYTPSITPLFGAIIWSYFLGVICCFLISGLIFGAVGLKWILQLQEQTVNHK